MDRERFVSIVRRTDRAGEKDQALHPRPCLNLFCFCCRAAVTGASPRAFLLEFFTDDLLSALLQILPTRLRRGLPSRIEIFPRRFLSLRSRRSPSSYHCFSSLTFCVISIERSEETSSLFYRVSEQSNEPIKFLLSNETR